MISNKQNSEDMKLEAAVILTNCSGHMDQSNETLLRQHLDNTKERKRSLVSGCHSYCCHGYLHRHLKFWYTIYRTLIKVY